MVVIIVGSGYTSFPLKGNGGYPHYVYTFMCINKYIYIYIYVYT